MDIWLIAAQGLTQAQTSNTTHAVSYDRAPSCFQLSPSAVKGGMGQIEPRSTAIEYNFHH
jgi:hypothetical protein